MARSVNDLVELAKSIIDGHDYMVLATSSPSGQPWASPVYFTADGYHDLYWVSSPAARHSHNIAGRTNVGIVIFDSRAAVGAAEAVYLDGRAMQVPPDELERGADLFRGNNSDLQEFTPDQLRSPAPFRLYRATITQHAVLIRGSDPDFGTGVDTRRIVNLGS